LAKALARKASNRKALSGIHEKMTKRRSAGLAQAFLMVKKKAAKKRGPNTPNWAPKNSRNSPG
jgi:hypothetical protein